MKSNIDKGKDEKGKDEKAQPTKRKAEKSLTDESSNVRQKLTGTTIETKDEKATHPSIEFSQALKSQQWDAVKQWIENTNSEELAAKLLETIEITEFEAPTVTFNIFAYLALRAPTELLEILITKQAISKQHETVCLPYSSLCSMFSGIRAISCMSFRSLYSHRSADLKLWELLNTHNLLIKEESVFFQQIADWETALPYAGLEEMHSPFSNIQSAAHIVRKNYQFSAISANRELTAISSQLTDVQSIDRIVALETEVYQIIVGGWSIHVNAVHKWGEKFEWYVNPKPMKAVVDEKQSTTQDDKQKEEKQSATQNDTRKTDPYKIVMNFLLAIEELSRTVKDAFSEDPTISDPLKSVKTHLVGAYGFLFQACEVLRDLLAVKFKLLSSSNKVTFLMLDPDVLSKLRHNNRFITDDWLVAEYQKMAANKVLTPVSLVLQDFKEVFQLLLARHLITDEHMAPCKEGEHYDLQENKPCWKGVNLLFALALNRGFSLLAHVINTFKLTSQQLEVRSGQDISLSREWKWNGPERCYINTLLLLSCYAFEEGWSTQSERIDAVCVIRLLIEKNLITPQQLTVEIEQPLDDAHDQNYKINVVYLALFYEKWELLHSWLPLIQKAPACLTNNVGDIFTQKKQQLSDQKAELSDIQKTCIASLNKLIAQRNSSERSFSYPPLAVSSASSSSSSSSSASSSSLPSAESTIGTELEPSYGSTPSTRAHI